MSKTEQQKVKEKIDGFLTGFTNKQVYGWNSKMDKDFVVENPPEEKKAFMMEMTRVPLWCPKCKKLKNKRLDSKMYWLHNMCLDCVAEFETKLRIEGKWEEYERNKIKENIRSFIKDTEQQVQEEKERLDSGTTAIDVVNENLGALNYEHWKLSNAEIQLHKNRMDMILKMMHEDFEKTYGEKVHVEENI